jgi:hypothetical protein
MSESAIAFRKIIEFCILSGSILGIPTILTALWAEKCVAKRSVFSRLILILNFLFASTMAIGTGSCVVGGFLEGVAICSFQPKHGPPLNPVDNFVKLQITYLIPFVLASFMALLFLTGAIFGPVNAWKKFLCIISLGRRGK